MKIDGLKASFKIYFAISLLLSGWLSGIVVFIATIDNKLLFLVPYAGFVVVLLLFGLHDIVRKLFKTAEELYEVKKDD